jgi:hypothetical protein
VTRWSRTIDAERLAQVLVGVTYPAAKWQLIMHAEEYGADAATRADLWSLPAGDYPDLDSVLAAVGGRRGAAQRLARYRILHAGPPRPAGRLRPLR